MDEVVINIEVTEEAVSVNPTEVIENVQVVTSEEETSTININTSEEVASLQVTEIEEKVEVLVDSELFKKHEEDFDHDNIPSDQMIQSWNGKAEGDHTHEGVYSPYNHNHDASYAPKVHSHSEYSSVFHNHDASYSGIYHNHDGVYEPKKGIDDLYVTSAEKTAWNGKAEGNHIHDGYAASDHTHEGYATADHTHDMSSFATTAYVNGLLGDIETILASI